MVSRSACACARSTPGFSRPIRGELRLCRSACSSIGLSSASAADGTHKSAVSGRIRPANRSGATPTTVKAVPFSTIVRPTTSFD